MDKCNWLHYSLVLIVFRRRINKSVGYNNSCICHKVLLLINLVNKQTITCILCYIIIIIKTVIISIVYVSVKYKKEFLTSTELWTELADYDDIVLLIHSHHLNRTLLYKKYNSLHKLKKLSSLDVNPRVPQLVLLVI